MNEKQLKLDDGTGLLDVYTAVSGICSFNDLGLRLGAMVECIGAIEEPSPPSSTTRERRSINATHVHEFYDHNIEALRMFEIMYLYKTEYAVPGSLPLTNFNLLAFPPHTKGGPKLKADLEQKAAADQRVGSRQSNNSGEGSSLVEKPWEQHRKDGLQANINIPPADYHFALPERDQEFIEQGTKSLEIRLNVAPYSIIHVNDRITINNKTVTTVVAVRKYLSLQTVLEAEDIDALFPQSSFSKAGSLNVVAAAERHFRQYFSTEEEEHCGLIVFQLAITLPSSSVPKSQEEWSALIFRHLEAKSDTGCSIADLGFAFPTLSVNQIVDILANLQFDALVVHLNDKYRLV